MFFWSEPKTPWWKVVFGREPKSQQIVADTYDDCVEMHNVVYGLEAPLDFLHLKSSRALVGVIKLNREDTLLTTDALCRSLGVDDVT